MSYYIFSAGDFARSSEVNANYEYALIEDIKTKLTLHKKTGYDAFSNNCSLDGLYDQTRDGAVSNLTYDSTSDFYYSTSATASYESKTQKSVSDEIIIPYFDYKVLTLYDDFEDASVDLTKWTITLGGAGGVTSSVTEGGGYMQVNAPAFSEDYAIAKMRGSSAFDLDDLTSNIIYIYIDFEMSLTHTAWRQIRLTDGTNNVVIYDNGGTATARRVMVFKIDKLRKLVQRLDSLTNIDISTLTLSNLNVEFFVYDEFSDGFDAIIKVYDVYYSADSPASTISLQGAPDATTYETVTNGTINELASNGTSKRVKISFTKAGSEMFLLNGVGFYVNGV